MDQFIAYKRALKKKYEVEKTDKHSGFLIKPTSAKLRDLCVQILKDKPSANDLQTFHNFFGSAFEETNPQKMQKGTEKFKPLATFLKDETEIPDYNSIAADMVAVLLDFPLRPYALYLKSVKNDSEIRGKSEDGLIAEGPETNLEQQKAKRKIWDKWKTAIAITIIIIATATVVKLLTKEVQCLTWKDDHYELVDCDGHNAIIPYREELTHFKKIRVSDTTTFFKDRQPIVWYSKQDNVLEYFNADGKNPATGKDLRPITTYIIHKHILKKK